MVLSSFMPAAYFWGLWGLARSLLIYYGKPGRARRDSRFYAQFIGRGALVFDVGAHVGNRVRVFLKLGAACIAVEPQPLFSNLLQKIYGRHPAFTLVETALGSEEGETELHISRRTPTVSTTADVWRDQVGRSPSFAGVTWEESVSIPVTTLDTLIDRFGMPDLCKIDVEGSELAVLQGLSRPLPLVSLEYIPAASAEAVASIARLEELGSYDYNWSQGESQQLREKVWLTPAAITSRLQQMEIDEPSGDIYARLN